MRKRSSLWLVGFVLLGVLALSVMVILLGGRESQSMPSADSYNPSGTAAMAELLRREGFEVVVDKYKRPRLQENDTAIVFVIPPQEWSYVDEDAEADQGGAPVETDRERTFAHVSKHVESGGTAVVLPVPREFQESSLTAVNTSVAASRVGREGQVSVTMPAGAKVDSDLFPVPKASYPLWRPIDNQDPIVSLEKNGDGVAASFRSGLLATNRFLARQDNATVLVDSIRTVSPQGGRIVFVEAAIGNIYEPGLMEILGPWAEAAWFQFLFLAAVILYTLSKPFGLFQEPRRKELGSRELLDAITFTLSRAHMTGFVLSAAKEEAKRAKLKQRLGTVSDGARDEIDETMAYLTAAKELDAPEDKTLDLMKKVDALVMPRRRVPRRSKRG